MGHEHQAGQRDIQNRPERGGSPSEQQIVPIQGRAPQAGPRLDDRRRIDLTTRGVLALQRTVGNAATGRWLRTVAAAAAARRGQPTARSASATGRVTRSAATLVQRHRSTSGLAEDKATTAFSQRAFDFWKKEKAATLEEFCAHLMEGVKARLGELPGPPPTPPLTFTKGLGYFQFNHSKWMIEIDPVELSTHENVSTVGQLDGSEVARLADTFWHESRHSEQHFRVARLRAEKMRQATGETKEDTITRQLAAELTIPDWVAKVAVAAAETTPLTDQTEREEAGGWYEFRVGKYVQYRLEVDWIRDLAWELRYWLKGKKYQTSQIVSAIDHADTLYKEALAAYNDYDDEVDAFAVGGAVTKKTKTLFDQANVKPSTEKPKAIASERKPTRDSLQKIIEFIKTSASGAGDEHFPAIRKGIETSSAHAFDKKVLEFIDRITKAAEPIAAFHSVSREDTQAEQVMVLVEFFENIRAGALKKLKETLASDAPALSDVQDRARDCSVKLSEMSDQEKMFSVDQLSHVISVKKKFSILDDLVDKIDEVDISLYTMENIDVNALLERADARTEAAEDDSDLGETVDTIDTTTLKKLRDAAAELDQAVAEALKGITSSTSGGPTGADQGTAASNTTPSGDATQVDHGPEGATTATTMAQPKQNPVAYGDAITIIKNRCGSVLELMNGEPTFGELNTILSQSAQVIKVQVSILSQMTSKSIEDLDSIQAIIEISQKSLVLQTTSRNYASVARQTIEKSGDKPIIKTWKSVQSLLEALGSLSLECTNALNIDLKGREAS